ncbi:hypothetical protein GGR58DRAFT_528792 [Xylaria digitata]|nr:hypothetical protein GGR58DRAFT_528792 [Xylaria digitata]
MSILCCCRNRQTAEKETQTEAVKLPIQPPRARLSKTLPRSDTDMYLSSILASRGPSQLVIPAYHNIVDPEAVDVEDSDDDGPVRNTRESSTGPLGSFRLKLIRRLSHRADAKAGSRPFAGTSDEELARRAELKRLMHKRIQEELKSEEEEEGEDDLRLAPLKPPSISKCKEPELPGGGPRDTIEFSVSTVDEQESRKEVGTLPETSLPPTPAIDEPQKPCQCRSACPEIAEGSLDNSYPECSVPLDEMGPAIPPPSPSPPTPVYLLGGSGRESPSTASWRLSYSAIHIESYIEPLVEARQLSRPQSLDPGDLFSKQEDDTTHPHETDTTTNYSNPTIQNETIDGSQTMRFDQGADTEINHEEDNISSDSIETSDGRYSPLDVWLRSQGLHCASVPLNQSNTEMTIEHPCGWEGKEQAEDRHILGNSTDLSGYKERTVDTSSILQEHDSGAWPISLKHITNNESTASDQVLSRIENALTTELHAIDQNQDVSSRYTSSRYTTQPNSQQATPGGSCSSLIEFLESRKIPQPLPLIHGSTSPYRVTTSDNSDISSYQTALNKTPSLDHAKSSPEVSQFPAAEALSINASETASFRQREEELKSIEKRFGLTPARQYPMAPVRSRFREEFEDPKGLNNGRSSILSKLYLALPRRSRTSSSHAELDKSSEEIGMFSTDCRKPEKVHLPGLDSVKDQSLSTNPVLEKPLEKRATGLWQRAKKQDADRVGRLKVKLNKSSMRTANMSNTEARSVSLNNYYPDIHQAQGVDGTKRDTAGNSFSTQPPNNMGVSKETELKYTAGIHTGVLLEWMEQLRAEDVQQRSRMMSRIKVLERQSPRFRTPPDSWAKWPSRTREERTASAGKKDKVKARDFAVVTNSSPSETGAGSKALPMERNLTITSRNLSSQVGKALKSGWNKMITHTGSIGRGSDHGLAGQSTQKPRGFLEYPELELLPTAEGYREVQALDQQIYNMKRRSTSGTRDVRQSSSDGARRPLASRIAEEVHKFQVEGNDIAWTDVQYPTKIPSTTQAVIKRAKSTGNIEAKLPVDEDAPTDHEITHKARKLGLRRHKSLGWIRGRGGQVKPIVSR